MPSTLAQSWPVPAAPRPIVVIGAGGIVSDAHLPAYRLAGFPVAGVFDLDPVRAQATADRFETLAFSSLDAALGIEGAVFDLALPPSAHAAVLRQIPEGSGVLIQKPMGADLDGAREILTIARRRKLRAAVNFQLRFAPMMLALKGAVERGWLGRIVDVEMHVNVMTPWDLWPFLQGMPRVEIAVHSIHYLDLIRSFLGDPLGVHAKTLGHPQSAVAQTRTSAILDYGAEVRCLMSVNHNHDFGRRFQDCSIRVEGTEGAAIAKLGVNLDYPRGEPDELWIGRKGGAWRQVELDGTWFPHAFIGTMANLQRVVSGEDASLVSGVEDAWRTMALVEACFESSALPAHPIASLPKDDTLDRE
ncbi:Gfo/Idh/MocA family oxidoreductase [Mesorhizobium sp. RP14(2022)]|uniref:Gfo/Idh/MocA family oxidoreductase n=1 Tax=Mesorhizobium liriopis TaxID=2953882 RepID=A0ABT1CAH0_9HYPH|nr:Gfo/Idh/MocA family oxidoreductase [Mesorhizobium liriopis]MCO6051829.1 Gfo/Idh/MocA family oxidoreductase [Mesorhizobium liriopis]